MQLTQMVTASLLALAVTVGAAPATAPEKLARDDRSDAADASGPPWKYDRRDTEGFPWKYDRRDTEGFPWKYDRRDDTNLK
ncbi:hypothetical protein BGZ60DRAFT_535793 [Tricladium varicosporioides]|nr:hypothetical protein BGZ60DRAFT_535793 [Hymenoscyphus varicosporioides]